LDLKKITFVQGIQTISGAGGPMMKVRYDMH
jgi:hypothetical protein